MAAADVVVRFLGDTDDLQRDLKQVDGSVNKVGDTFKGLARTAVTALGTIAVAQFARDATQAAINMAESQNKLKAVFEDSTREIRKHIVANDALIASYLGGRQAATDAAGSFGNMLQQMGFTADQTVNMSKGLLNLTADLVSFHNADPTEVIQAIGGAFRGEYDSLQRWVPTITAAAVEQRALTDTGKASADQLTNTEKAAAAYALAMEGAGKATGDAAKTFDGAAGKQRRMQEQLQEMELQIGQALLPVITLLAPKVTALAEAFEKLGSSTTTAVVVFAAFAAVALAVGGFVGLIIALAGALVAAYYVMWTEWDKIWNWMIHHPAVAIILSIIAAPIVVLFLLIGAVKLLWENWRDIWNWIKQATTDAKNSIVNAFNNVVDFFKALPGQIAGALAALPGIIGGAFLEAVWVIGGIPGQIVSFFWGLDMKILGAVGSLFNVGRHIMQSMLDGIESLAGSVLGKIKDIGGKIAGALNPFGSPQTVAYYAGQGAVTDYLAGVASRLPSAVRTMEGYGGRLTPALASGSVSTYNVTVNVPPGVPPASVGAATVDAIRAYERLNGKAWRQS